MQKSTIFGIGIFILIVGGFLFFNKEPTVTANVINNAPIQGEIQKVLIGEKDLNYYPSEIKVKVNQPVEITLDDSVKGCLRSFSIKNLGVSKYAKTPQEKIAFTPTQTGTFTFTCSMGMGFGKLIVE